jgi:hypothetical protein
MRSAREDDGGVILKELSDPLVEEEQGSYGSGRLDRTRYSLSISSLVRLFSSGETRSEVNECEQTTNNLSAFFATILSFH